MLNFKYGVRASVVEEERALNADCRGLNILKVDGRGPLSCVVLSEFAVFNTYGPWACLFSELFMDSVFNSGIERFVSLISSLPQALIIDTCWLLRNFLTIDVAGLVLLFVVGFRCLLKH